MEAIHVQHFDPKEYLETYFSFRQEKDAAKNLLTFSLKTFHQAFILDEIKGDTLIGIGSGPCIFQFLSACESFREIIATDYTDQNREEMQRWLKKEPDGFDWSPVVKYVCELEGDREKWTQKEELLRRTLKQVLKCDVTQPSPLAPVVLPPADCLLCCLFLEVDCKDLASFRSALKNLSSLLKPGGHLLLFSVLDETFYVVGQRRFSFLFLDREFLEEAVGQAGFDIKWVKEARLSFPSSVSDVKGACMVVAQKRLC